MLHAAIFGTGSWARSALVPALRTIEGVEVVACVGRTMDGARSFAAETQIPRAYDSLEGALASEADLGLVVVAGPDSTHVAATRLALEAGIPVYCEKPLANSTSEAHGLARLSKERRVPATVGYSFRYSPALQALQKDVRHGILGDPWLLELFEYNAQFHPQSGKPMNWKGDPSHAGAGALFEYGSHVVDLAEWFAGPINAVVSNLASVRPGARLDDIATLQLRLRPPAIGVLVSGWVLSGSMPGIRIRWHGSQGLAEVELSETVPGNHAYRRYRFDGSIQTEERLEMLGNPWTAYPERHLSDFVSQLGGQSSAYPQGTLPTLADGAKVQEVLEASLMAQERWVTVRRHA